VPKTKCILFVWSTVVILGSKSLIWGQIQLAWAMGLSCLFASKKKKTAGAIARYLPMGLLLFGTSFNKGAC